MGIDGDQSMGMRRAWPPPHHEQHSSSSSSSSSRRKGKKKVKPQFYHRMQSPRLHEIVSPPHSIMRRCRLFFSFFARRLSFVLHLSLALRSALRASSFLLLPS